MVAKLRDCHSLTAGSRLPRASEVAWRTSVVMHLLGLLKFHRTLPRAAHWVTRRQNRHQAIVVITRGARPGFCPSNARSFLRPFGPPVLQVTSEEALFLADCARQGSEAVLTAHVERTQAQAFNVVAAVSGTNKSLAPLVVMT